MSQCLTLAQIPMFVLWWNVEGVLLALGQGAFSRSCSFGDADYRDAEAEVAAYASLYLRWLSLGIPGYGGNVIVKKLDRTRVKESPSNGAAQ